MGVPSYYRHLIQKYLSIIKKEHSFDKKKNLYFDFNALIHNVVQEVLSKNKLNNYKIKVHKELENEMFKQIVLYTDMIIRKIDPDFTYISVDGIVPRFKMKQQRFRRFKSVLDKKMDEKKRAREEPHAPRVEELFDRNCISPGTKFMDKLSDKMKEYVAASERDIVFSDHTNFGEGEHRIMKYMRENSNDDRYHIIYSLDADIIMLSILSYDKEIYLLREKQFFEKKSESSAESKEEFHYLNIEALKESLWIESQSYLAQYITKKEYLLDYIFLCFFMGNDFMPHLKELNIHKNGLELIMNTYTKFLREHKESLWDFETNQINRKFLIDILKDIALQENILVKRNSNKRDKEVIGYGDRRNWKENHYKYFFRTTDKNKIKIFCKDYIKTLIWTMKYYKNNLPESWRFYYRFKESPCLSDIVDYLENSNLNIRFHTDKPYTFDQSLMMILPKESFYLIKPKYQNLMKKELLEYFPDYYKLEKVNKPIPWMYEPILRNIDDRKIEKYID